jgi:hypothetical protein
MTRGPSVQIEAGYPNDTRTLITPSPDSSVPRAFPRIAPVG